MEIPKPIARGIGRVKEAVQRRRETAADRKTGLTDGARATVFEPRAASGTQQEGTKNKLVIGAHYETDKKMTPADRQEYDADHLAAAEAAAASKLKLPGARRRAADLADTIRRDMVQDMPKTHPKTSQKLKNF